MSKRKRRSRWSKAEMDAYSAVGSRVGIECEARVLHLLLSRKIPAFCVGAPRKATLEEDAAKMDIVVETDRGTMGVQVKRNLHRAAVAARHLPAHVACIAAGEDRSDNIIWIELMQAMARTYKRLAKARPL